MSHSLGIRIIPDTHCVTSRVQQRSHEEGIRVVKGKTRASTRNLTPSQKVRDLRIQIFTASNFEKQAFIPFELTNSFGLEPLRVFS